MQAAIASKSGFSVSEVNERAAFSALEGEWDALVASTRDEPFLRHAFLRVWIDNFAPRHRLRVLLARDAQGRLCAALPLVERRRFLCGVPVRELTAAANAHSCRFDLIASDAASAARAFLSHLEADDGWDVLRLTDVPEGGSAWRLLEAAQESGLPTGTWESLRSPYLPLHASADAFEQTLSSKFRANCRRRRKRLEEKGRVTFEAVTGGELVDAHLEEGLALEAAGWKGRRGTAIAQSADTRGFYRELAHVAKHEGWLSLFFLRLDGRPVAFHYGLRHGGRYLLLKPAYDEALSECSPGQLLMLEVVRTCVGERLTELDFLGPDMPWKREWTDRVRPHHWLFVFRDTTLGRAIRAAKFRWVSWAKKRVARWRR